MTDLNKRVIEATLKKKRVPPKLKPAPYPKSVERIYNENLQQITKSISEQVKLMILPILQSVAFDLGQETIRKDAGVNDITKAIEAMKLNLSRKYTEQELKNLAVKSGMSLVDFTRKSTEKEFKRVLGIDLFINDRPLTSAVEMFSSFNIQLSKSLIDDSVNKVQSTILSGFQSGTRWENIASDIEDYIDPEIGGIANRARLIARDQISTLNAQVTQKRQTELGINNYIWRTSQDERVRDSHKELEGTTQSWDSPPSVGHPGEDYNCRCTAEPILDGFFE